MILIQQNKEAGNPFSEVELAEISSILFEGIFKYEIYPFFSLHFNEDRGLYSVIHSAYKNTIIGEVIGYLYYYVKC